MADVLTSAPAERTGRRARALVACIVLLAAVCLLSLLLGARAIGPAAVFHALVDPNSADAGTVRGLRLPRTFIGLAAGAALGLSGTVMQGVTRNPLADPGLLGVNAGASLFVVAGITWLHADNPSAYVWLAFAGAAVASLLVHGIASRGPGGASPFRLALAGAAITAAATSLVSVVLITSRTTLQQYRFFSVGSLSDPHTGALIRVLPFLVVGLLLAATSGRAMNALALGTDSARGLGIDVGRTQVRLGVGTVLLCGSATAIAGPIAFVGLAVAHIARRLAGADHRWILAFAGLLGPVVLLGADIIGRLVAPPGELEAGIVAAFLGAPVMIAMVRRGRVVPV